MLPQEHLGPVKPKKFEEKGPVPRKFGYATEDDIKTPFVSPIGTHIPPKHTQLTPRCFTCSHFQMCSYKRDYLKTITLVQKALGAPQEDFELRTDVCMPLPSFDGSVIEEGNKYFPETISFENEDEVGKFFQARFLGASHIKAVYKVKKYFILLDFLFDETSELFELQSCKEIFYQIDYELSNTSLEEIQLKLMDIRTDDFAANAQPKATIINTTHFSSTLECDMYEWNKKTFEDVVEELNRKYPNGYPIEDDGKTFYHIATFHVEPAEVPYSTLYFAQPPKEKTPPVRRGDL